MSSIRFNLLRISFYITLLLGANTSQSQNNASTSLHDWYDSKVGKENLDLNNGKILLNYDIILKITTGFILAITLWAKSSMITSFTIMFY